MFEFEIQDLRHIRLRIGGWHFRTWRSAFTVLSRGYRSPEPIYTVEWEDVEGNSGGQLGAFYSLQVAEACRTQLVDAEGYTNLVINLIPVHTRLKDWELDR
ncbi:hypothetical protein QF047_004149 [Arthrobacter sp. W4I7]|nr:hypothetical protein [Arthrobacter sp. W4I7]